MAKLPMKPTQMKKDDVMKDDIFGEELSLAEDVAPEGAIDNALEAERNFEAEAAPAEGSDLTPEEQDILTQAEEIMKAKKKAYDDFMKGSDRTPSPEEEKAEGEMPPEDESMTVDNSPMKKMKAGQNFY